MSDNNTSNNPSHRRNSSHSIERHHSRSSNHSKRSYASSSYSNDSSRRSYSRRSRSHSRDYSRRHHPSRENVGFRIFITNLDPQVTEKDIEKEFRVYGEIKNINLKRGYAFVEYFNEGDAKNAIRKYHRRSYSYSSSPEPKPKNQDLDKKNPSPRFFKDEFEFRS